jgi:sugar phosphate isomerase/epimerase
MFTLGLNPYGLTCTVGLQAMGTPRANPRPIGLDGFINLADELELPCIELDWRWLARLDDASLGRLRERLAGFSVVYSHWLAQEPGESLADPIRRAAAIDAQILRLHLTPVLEGARAAWGPRWAEMIAHARRTLRDEAGRAGDAGLIVAIENHQDLGSEELVALAEELGDHVGIVLDTGNPFAVGEDPVAFAQRAAHRIRHVHLKDYVAQFTAEGYRLVRCAIGDGAVPFEEIAAVLAAGKGTLTASIEPGALEARHIRLFTPGWWDGYPPREARELGVMLGRLRRHALADDADCRTPWERGAPPEELMAYEMAHIRRSLERVRALGLG